MPSSSYPKNIDTAQHCVDESQILPHDPDGYLNDFQRAVPSADPVIREYLSESLQCFRRDLNRAAAVMLGAASEQAVLRLIESYANSIVDANRKAQALSQVDKASSIFRKYELFEKGLRRREAQATQTACGEHGFFVAWRL
jgi:CHASE3 domain sensor protein